MLYVLDQRLKAQNILEDKANKGEYNPLGIPTCCSKHVLIVGSLRRSFAGLVVWYFVNLYSSISEK